MKDSRLNITWTYIITWDWKGLREPSMIDGFEVRDLEALIEAVEWMRDGKRKREDEWDNVLGSKDDTER